MLLIVSILLSLCIISNADEIANSRVVGGKEVEKGRYPFSVSLTRSGRHKCGGSLISPEYILTAAHCADAVRDAEIGRHDRGYYDDYSYEKIGIANKFIHPDYNEFTLENDVMVVQLYRRVSSNYTAITLDDNPDFLKPEDIVTTMGWGRISYGGEVSEVQLETEVDVISNEECASAPSSYYRDNIIEGSLCAYREGTDSCQGDSGGPLIVKGENSTSDVLVGTVSWGVGCAYEGYPGVYARVSSYVTWIKAVALIDVPTASPTAAETYSKIPSSTPSISSFPSFSHAPSSSNFPSLAPTFNVTPKPTELRCSLQTIFKQITTLFQ